MHAKPQVHFWILNVPEEFDSDIKKPQQTPIVYTIWYPPRLFTLQLWPLNWCLLIPCANGIDTSSMRTCTHSIYIQYPSHTHTHSRCCIPKTMRMIQEMQSAWIGNSLQNNHGAVALTLQRLTFRANQVHIVRGLQSTSISRGWHYVDFSSEQGQEYESAGDILQQTSSSWHQPIKWPDPHIIQTTCRSYKLSN